MDGCFQVTAAQKQLNFCKEAKLKEACLHYCVNLGVKFKTGVKYHSQIFNNIITVGFTVGCQWTKTRCSTKRV